MKYLDNLEIRVRKGNRRENHLLAESQEMILSVRSHSPSKAF
ncbi:hypothetical protein QUF80_04695 [Desulfococcaceae bacterium HSG8]|nr:hypothetical protein [Desulfococcaceae bacterium HSG8]